MPWCKYLVSTWPPQWKPSGSDESSVEPLQIYHMRSSPPLFPQLCMSLRPARRWKTEGSTLWVSNMLSYALTPDLNRLFIFCSCQSAVAASVSDSVTAFHEKLFHTDPDELPEKYERSCSRLLCCCILAFLLNWVVLQFVIKSSYVTPHVIKAVLEPICPLCFCLLHQTATKNVLKSSHFPLSEHKSVKMILKWQKKICF